jgi:hypothetical protein
MAIQGSEFATGLGLGLGKSFPLLDQLLQNQLMSLCELERYNNLSFGMGMSLGINFQQLSIDIQQKIFERVKINPNSKFVVGWVYGIKNSIKKLNVETKDKLRNIVEDFNLPLNL